MRAFALAFDAASFTMLPLGCPSGDKWLYEILSIDGTWVDGFPDGWSCEGCVGSQGIGEREPVGCGEVEIQTGEAIEETE